MKKNTALVLEGGGLRGAYTAGALSWLIDNGVSFDHAYGISTGAVYLSTYLMGSKENLKYFSTNGITDKRIVGLKPLLRCGHIVDYEFLFDVIMAKELQYDISPLKDIKTDAKIGVYVLEDGKTEYLPVQDITMQELKASTSLPIIGKVFESHGKHLLDGGITDMIPIEEAISDGCDRYLIITTKPGDYVRKPAKDFVVKVMKRTYPQCENISYDYKIRHLNYQKQIDIIKGLQEENKAIYVYPSKHSKVTRLGGSQEDLEALYDLGYADMENQKETILALLK
ncbi:MAG: patatin family protein [Erysipelotrichaceae bacterium]|nr:patatin family protein [Erysipelotrichaceae bacterium]